MALSASVVVCTRNRARELTDTLRSVIGQSTARDLEWEILVIDNGAGDDTAAAAHQAAEKSPVELRYLVEPKLGLAIARNRGWWEARGEIVAYLDDDTFADPRWLHEIIGSYRSPRIAGVGGRLLPQLDPESRQRLAPAWLAPYTHDRGEVERDVAVLSGANMSFRREQLAQIGGFDIRLGRIGACTLAGDEQDVCRALRRQPGGLRIVYNPRALVHHQISVESCTDAGLIKRSYCGGISNAVLDRKETAARRALALAVRPLKLALWLVRQLHHRASGLPPDLAQTARLQEFVGYYKELALGSEAACRECPMYPLRRPRF